jgi:phytoene synthase
MNQSASSDVLWTQAKWQLIEEQTASSVLNSSTETEAWALIVRQARAVLKTYSTSFYVVTRFLPRLKREMVEIIYLAVRLPDEVVDTFPLSREERQAWLGRWEDQYKCGLGASSIHEAMEKGSSCFVAGFTKVVREANIPREHYLAFLRAMKLDSEPRAFATLKDLIDNYVYGSAIVVGYFLTHVYGSVSESEFSRALRCSRNLGIALQLTNFLRDVGEDFRRGRIYLPLDMLLAEGIDKPDFGNPQQYLAVSNVVVQLVDIAEEHYAYSMEDLDAFNLDSRTAIEACIKVYRRLNDRIRQSRFRPPHRESVPALEKFQALPASKYWRIPLAYLSK